MNNGKTDTPHPLNIGLDAGMPFCLPLELVTQSIAILAKKRVGKSYTAAVIAEELMQAGQQVVIIDPTGAHWGLRSSADGKRPGFSIVVFGGDHADLPLQDGAGEVLAQAIVAQRFSAIIDLSNMRKGQATRFLATFFETLYRLNRQPMNLICDEADAYAPQKPWADEARTLGAMEDLVRRGGIRGIGTTLITQRPAVINKNVLTQCEVLVALRLVHPKDIAAVMEWVNVHAEPAMAKQMINGLPSLPIGTAWFWSPGWGDIFAKVNVRPRKTFDSGATPKPGQVRIAPKVLAQIDVEKLGAEIQATAEQAKADDPKELRRQIADLQRQLASRPAPKPEIDVKAIERAAKQSARHECAASIIVDIEDIAKRVEHAQTTARKFLADNPPSEITPSIDQRKNYKMLASESLPRRESTAPAAAAGAGLTGPERRILDAIAWLQSIGVSEPEQTAVAFLAGYTIGGGAFNNPRGSLRSKGLLEYRGDVLVLTDAGSAAANTPEQALTRDELHRRILERLPGPEQKLLRALIDAYPKPMTNEALARAAGYEPGGGAFNNPRGRLRSLGLVYYPDKGLVEARGILFP